MTKSSDRLLENIKVMEQYAETFGEDSGLIYIDDVDRAVSIYKECLERGKSYEELYGEQRKDVLY